MGGHRPGRSLSIGAVARIGPALGLSLGAACTSPPPETPLTSCARSFVEIDYHLDSGETQQACLAVPADMLETYEYSHALNQQRCNYAGIDVSTNDPVGPFVKLRVENDVFAHTGGANMNLQLSVPVTDAEADADAWARSFEGSCAFDITQAGPVGSEVTARLHGTCTLPVIRAGALGANASITSLVIHGRLAKITYETDLDPPPDGQLVLLTQRCPE